MSKLIGASQVPVVTAGAYSAGDAVGGLLTFSGCGGNGSGKVVSVVVIDQGDQGVALNLFLSKQSFTATADNDPIALTDADALNGIGVLNIATTDYIDAGGVKIATKQVGNLGFVDGVDSSLYGQMWTTGTPTYASVGDLKVLLVVEMATPLGA